MKTLSAIARKWKRRILRDQPKILIVRHEYKRTFYNVIIKWVRRHHPSLLRLLAIRDLPYRLRALDDVALHVPWLQDPVQDWSVEAYQQANELAAQCEARGIPIVNRVDRLLNAAKCEGARRMTQAGIRTPRITRIVDVDAFKQDISGMNLPLFIREDWGHGGTIHRVDRREELLEVPFDSFVRPVAIELVDTADPRDGLYRKFRYVAAGDNGVSHHLQVSETWIVRGEHRVKTDATRAEEEAYIDRLDPNHEMLQRARRALGLDFVAFDYSYDSDGRIIVWEANPYPFIQFSRKSLTYRNRAMDRTVAAMIKMYLEYASLPVPAQLAQPMYPR